MRTAVSPAHEPARGATAVAIRFAGSWWFVISVGVAVFGLQLFAVLLRPAGAVVSAWWPASGVAIAATILATGRRRWAVLGAVAVASVASALVAGRSPTAALWLLVISCSEAAIAGCWLTRGGRPELRTGSDLRRLLLVLSAAALVAGGLGALGIVVRLDGDPWTTWWAVAASHGAAALLLVPQVMLLPERAPRHRAETVALWVALLVSILAVFAPGQRIPLAFLPVALLVWTGLRLSIRVVSAQLVVAGVLAAALTVAGAGPFAESRAVAPEIPGGLVQLYLVVCAIVGFALVISVAQRDVAIAALADQLSFSRAMVEVLDVGIVACDATGAVVVRNAAHRRLPGERDGPGEPDLERALDGAAAASRTVRLGEHDVVISSRRIDGPGGRVLGAVAAFADVTAERAVQARLRESAAFHDAVIAASPDIIYVVDIETRHSVWTSPTLPATLEYSSQQLTELGPRIVDGPVHPEDRDRLDSAYAAAADLADGEVASLVVRVGNGHGEYRWLSRLITPFARGEDGAVRQLLGVARDITEIVESEQQLTEAALHDPLTGLPNRRLLTDRLESALRRASSTDCAVVVLFCDLDGFKQVNDTGGHAAGDAVLAATADRLRTVLRPQDTVARVGGDEFVVVLDPLPMRVAGGPAVDAPENRARSVVRRIISSLGDPVEVAGIRYRVTVSIGVTYARAGDSVGDTLRDADAAMYRAKLLGKARHETFDRCRSQR